MTAATMVVTREMIENIRFVQNSENVQLMIPDLGKNGLVLGPYEKVDLSRFFSKRELGQSSQLDWCLKSGALKMLKTPDNIEEAAQKGTELEFKDEVEDKDKKKMRGEELPKDVPVVDREETKFDEGLDAQEDKEIADDEETKLSKKRRKPADA